MTSRIGSTYVPSVGPLNAKIMFVGEAPGKDEEIEGEPFVGKSGQLLERYLGRIGIQRKNIRLTNLCHYRPGGNKFENLLGSEELKAGLAELGEEISKVNPNLIVALGNWPMFYLTGKTAEKGKMGTGITSWRGSVVFGTGIATSYKVLITYHPAFIIRPQGFGNHPIFLNDLKRAKVESLNPKLEYPEYESFIDPPALGDLTAEMGQAEWLTVDIETFRESLACVGFADSVKRGLCITCENPLGWEPARELLMSPAKKIFQYGTFDINYLKWHYGWEVENYAFDTYIAMANLFPEFPRALEFQTSIYTPFPFYKNERKVHKQTGDLGTLWRYNLKDLIATHWIALEQMKELRELYGANH